MATWLKNKFSKYSDYVILLLFPFLLIIANSNWIYTPPLLSPDPWFYFANFRYFFSYAPAFPSNTHYFIERITWNVPGYYIYQIFTPEVANTVLHLAVYYIAIFSLYSILRILFNKRTALISALVMGSYPWFLRASGWDYVDGVGIAQMLLLLLFLLLAVLSPQWKIYLFAAGIVHTSLLTTNIFWIIFTPAWLAFFLLVNCHYHKFKLRQLFLASCFFLAGNLILVLILGIFYYRVTGNFIFIKNTIVTAINLSSDEKNKRNIIEFYGQMPAYWHLLPMMTAIAATNLLLSNKKSDYHYSFIVVAITFAISYGLFTLWHYLSIPYLLVYLYCTFLIPPTFLLFGSLFAVIFDEFSRQNFKLLTGFVIFTLSLPLFLTTWLPFLNKLQDNKFIIASLILVVLIGLNSLRNKHVLIPLFLGLSGLFYLSASNIGVYVTDPNLNKNNFLVLTDTMRFIDTYYKDWEYSDFRFWHKEEENLFTSISLSSVYLYPWGSTVTMPPSGNYVWPDVSTIKDGNIILVSVNPDPYKILNEANLSLKSNGALLSFESAKRFVHGNVSLTLVFTKLNVEPITLKYGEKFEFNKYSPAMKNFHFPEKNDKTYMWSGPENESGMNLIIPSSKQGSQIQICVISALQSETLDSLQLFINNQEIPITRTESKNCPYLYEGVIKPIYLSENFTDADIQFHIGETAQPFELEINNDTRELGLAFDWIKFDKVR